LESVAALKEHAEQKRVKAELTRKMAELKE